MVCFGWFGRRCFVEVSLVLEIGHDWYQHLNGLFLLLFAAFVFRDLFKMVLTRLLVMDHATSPAEVGTPQTRISAPLVMVVSPEIEFADVSRIITSGKKARKYSTVVFA